MKKYLFIVSLLLSALLVQAQRRYNVGEPSEKKWFAGGNFGMTFGDYTFINIAPQIGYRFNRYFAAGGGINAEYLSMKSYDVMTGDLYSKEKRTILGLNLFGRVYPIKNIMLQVQPEGNYLMGNISFYDTSPTQKVSLNSEFVPSLLVGGGLVLPGSGGEFIISLMYDALQYKDSPYGKRAVFNFGYNFNFK